MKAGAGRFMASLLLFLCVAAAQAWAEWPRIAASKDGVPISFEVHGSGEPTLVFVHGWSCDSRYWREQVPALSPKHRVVVLDLAGHGHSGAGRKRYTTAAFGAIVLPGADHFLMMSRPEEFNRALENAVRMLPGG